MQEQMEIAIIFVSAIFFVIAFWRICSKAGFPRVLSLLILIPVVNLALLSMLAFTEWPALVKQQQDFDDNNS
jgi:hypothetical protein